MLPERKFESFIPCSSENNVERGSPPIIIYAGASPKRLDILKLIFDKSEVINIPAGDEKDIPEVVQIAEDKINSVKGAIRDNGIMLTQQQIGIFAADTRDRILEPNHTDVHLKSYGKPKNLEEIKDHFRALNISYNKFKIIPTYFVDSATVYLSPEEEFIRTIKTTTIRLNESRVADLTTEEGFASYLRIHSTFYSSETYSQYGYIPMTPFDSSAGFSLPTLLLMGAVESINEVGINDPEFPDAFKSAMYNVAVGIDPDVIKKVQLNAMDTIDKWSWLNQVTSHCLNKKNG